MEDLQGQPSSVSSSPTDDPHDQVLELCRTVLASLIRADGGELYLVSATAEDIHIHLAGTCSGCPGATFTGDTVLKPLLSTLLPKASLRVTTGWRVPEGARKVEPGDAAPR